jgi:hypothetical protein
MRYLPYIILLLIVIFVTGKLQSDQQQIQHVAERDCAVQKDMYAIISHSLRNQATLGAKAAMPLSQVNALLEEADQTDHAALSLPNCVDRPLQAHAEILPSPKP